MTNEQKRKIEYRQKHKEKISEYNKAYYQAHKEYFKEYDKKWRKKNKRVCIQKQTLYSVWNNYTDELIILDGTARQCADAMGISFKSFHSTRTRLKQGILKKWTIETRVVES